jgi:hypothetical protein
MIAIVNIGGGNPEDMMGVRNYEVRINHQVIATFAHRRSDGLGVCLQKASAAVEAKKWKQADKMIQTLKDTL